MVEEEWLEEKEVKVKNEDGRLWGWSEKKRARAGLVGEESEREKKLGRGCSCCQYGGGGCSPKMQKKTQG